MPTFTPMYVEPGVYLEFADVAVPSAPPGIFIPAIVGTGKLTITTMSQVIKGAANGQDTLKYTPVFAITSIVDRAGKTYVQGVDYQLTTNTVDWSLGGSEPATGSTYFVTYTYIKGAANFNPYLTTRLDNIYALYGNPVFPNQLLTGTATAGAVGSITTGITMTVDQYKGNYIKILSGTGVGQERLIISNTVAGIVYVAPNFTLASDVTSVFQINDISSNTISIQAQISVRQGSTWIYVVQIEDDTATGWQNAIDSLQNIDCYAVILAKGLATGNSLLAYTKNHIDQMSSMLERKFRIALFGAPVNTTDTADFISAANGLNDERCAYIAPSDQILNINGTGYIVDGSYLAAAISGIVCNPNYTWGEPISGKSVIVFDDVGDIFIRAEKNEMAANGVFVVERENPGDFRVRHALSTNPASPVTQELKVTRIKDGVARFVIRNLKNTFINTRNLGPESIANVTAFIKFLLGVVKGRRDIVDFDQVDVIQNVLEPRQIDLKIRIKPTFDINWMFVTLGVTI